MIKLKEGQKVLDIEGNVYLIEKEDVLIERVDASDFSDFEFVDEIVAFIEGMYLSNQKYVILSKAKDWEISILTKSGIDPFVVLYELQEHFDQSGYKVSDLVDGRPKWDSMSFILYGSNKYRFYINGIGSTYTSIKISIRK
ncbi:MAG: hypothetical protein AB7V16_07000 [Vulcanibacillus sp.]